jgi:hypothetical protein
MSMAGLVQLGAPGVYALPRERQPPFAGERMDVCAFVGVAPRGPCREPLVDHTPAHDDSWRMCDPDRPSRRTVPVAVESFEAYGRVFGGAEGPFAGPGLLPYAVSAFFEQGGRRAYVARIVHDYAGPKDRQGVATGFLAGTAAPVRLRARNEGSWGDKLNARLAWTVRPVAVESFSLDHLMVREGEPLGAGELLRLRLKDGSAEFRFIVAVETFGDPFSPSRRCRALLDAPATGPITAAEAVEGSLTLSDGTGTTERHERLGLSASHPRWIGTVLCRESALVWPDWSWAGGQVLPAAVHLPQPEPPAGQFTGGRDRYGDLRLDDFFDPSWTSLADSDADGAVPAGVQALATLPDLTHIVVPDLYQPALPPPTSDIADPSLASANFEPCFEAPLAEAPAVATSELPGLLLDPRLPGDLENIIAQQRKLVDFVEATREQIVLLDVPPGLPPPAVQAWRSRFDSAYAAAYHPWPDLVRADGRSIPVSAPPSAIAAGVIADRERRFGLAAGPANALARQAVRLDQTVTPQAHATLHPQGINVFAFDVDGVRLTAARTLSRDRQWRQLSVRRLMLMLRRALKRQMAWAVFEPNGPTLRRDLQRTLSTYLRGLYVAGAFRGGTEAEAFFVRCDEINNPRAQVDAGQLVVEIGVAPVEPLEFILLRIVRKDDGNLVAED